MHILTIYLKESVHKHMYFAYDQPLNEQILERKSFLVILIVQVIFVSLQGRRMAAFKVAKRTRKLFVYNLKLRHNQLESIALLDTFRYFFLLNIF